MTSNNCPTCRQPMRELVLFTSTTLHCDGCEEAGTPTNQSPLSAAQWYKMALSYGGFAYMCTTGYKSIDQPNDFVCVRVYGNGKAYDAEAFILTFHCIAKEELEEDVPMAHRYEHSRWEAIGRPDDELVK